MLPQGAFSPRHRDRQKLVKQAGQIYLISREGLEKSFLLRAIICIGGLNEKNVLECSNLEGFFQWAAGHQENHWYIKHFCWVFSRVQKFRHFHKFNTTHENVPLLNDWEDYIPRPIVQRPNSYCWEVTFHPSCSPVPVCPCPFIPVYAQINQPISRKHRKFRGGFYVQSQFQFTLLIVPNSQRHTHFHRNCSPELTICNSARQKLDQPSHRIR